MTLSPFSKAIGKLDGQIKRIDANTYEVKYHSGHGIYEVLKGSLGWMCQCQAHILLKKVNFASTVSVLDTDTVVYFKYL